MNVIKVSLSVRYDSKAPSCRISCCGETVFDSTVKENIELKHEISSFKKFSINLVKTGKTLDIVNRKEEQLISIDRINLNGIDLKVKEFGNFKIKDNPYVHDDILKTNKLHFNGEWSFELPERKLFGTFNINHTYIENKKFPYNLRDQPTDCDVACFGCSETYGTLLPYEQSWPSQLDRLTDGKVKNFGFPGSSTNEITCFVDYYLKNYSTKTIIVYLPHSFRRQVMIGNNMTNIGVINGMAEKFNKELFLHGSEHSIAVLSAEIYKWMEKISMHTNIYFGTYHSDESSIYEKTQLKKFMIPFLEGDDYPRASDDIHHGPGFNQDFAKIIHKFLQNKKKPSITSDFLGG